MPTEQQVTEAAPDVWPNVGASANALGRSKEDVLNEIETIFNEKYLVKFDDPKVRLRQAVSIMYARLVNAESAHAEPFEFYILGATTPREIKTKNGPNTVAEVSGIAQKLDDKKQWDRAFAKITLWGKHAEQAIKAAGKTEKMVKVWARGGLNGGFYDLSSTDKTHFNEEIVTAEALDPLAVVQRYFRRILIREAPDNISKGFGDLRLIRSTVSFARVTTNEQTGKSTGMYRVYDESVPHEETIKKGFSVLIDPTQVKFDTGSVVWFLGRITTSEQYGVGMAASCALPEVGVPLNLQIAPPKTPAGTPTPEGAAKFSTGWGN